MAHSSESLSAFRQLVVTRCRDRDPTDVHYFVLPGSPPLFIKYGDSNLRGEARTLRYLYDVAKDDPHAPYVPKIIDAFSENGDDAEEDDNRYTQGPTFIVMEYIDAPTLRNWIDVATSALEREERESHAATRVAEAISWIHGCPVPDGNGLGPKKGGIVQHIWFADSVAPMPFANTEALQVYVNACLTCVSLRCRLTCTGSETFAFQAS